MATTITYTSDGVTRDLVVPFPYMAKSHVYVVVDGIATTAFTWLTTSTIRLNPEVGIAAGAPITVSRRTPTGTNPVTFSDGSVLGEGDLNMIATYAAYITEEAREFTDRAEAAAANAAVSRDLVAANTLTAAQAAEDAEAAAAAAATFDPALYVPRAGGVELTGHLSVPAGAEGAQAPRASEVGRLAVTNTFTAPQYYANQTVHGVAYADISEAPIRSRAAGTGAGAGAAVIALERPGAFAALLGLDSDNALAFGGGSLGAVRHRVFHEGLMDSFFAAGGVEEHGANANGYYWRTRQGFQICYRTVGASAGGATAVLWPAYFTSAPHVAAVSYEAGSRTVTTTSVDAYGFGANLWTDTGARANGVACVIAVGRWK